MISVTTYEDIIIIRTYNTDTGNGIDSISFDLYGAVILSKSLPKAIKSVENYLHGVEK